MDCDGVNFWLAIKIGNFELRMFSPPPQLYVLIPVQVLVLCPVWISLLPPSSSSSFVLFYHYHI